MIKKKQYFNKAKYFDSKCVKNIIILHSNDGKLQLKDKQSMKQVRAFFTGIPQGFRCLFDLSPNRKSIAEAADYLLIQDVCTKRDIGRSVYVGNIISFCYSPDSKYIYSVDKNNGMVLWDAHSAKKIRNIQSIVTDQTRSIQISPKYNQIATGQDGYLYIQDQNMKVIRSTHRWYQHSSHLKWAEINCLKYSSDEKLIATGYNNHIRIWNSLTARVHGKPLQGHSDNIINLLFSDDASYLVSSGMDNSIRVWNLQSRQEVYIVNGHIIVDFNNNSQLLFTSQNKIIYQRLNLTS